MDETSRVHQGDHVRERGAKAPSREKERIYAAQNHTQEFIDGTGILEHS